MINGTCFKNAIISGTNNILKNKDLVNALNIFPVPDGDTGTNMSMTICAASSEINKINSDSIGEVSKLVASAMLRGARGNSGVILSLLFRGIANGLVDLKEANGEDIVRALGIGVDDAYKAVMNPTEGTMLTVARMAFEEALIVIEDNNDPVAVWSAICKGAEEALALTPEMLPILKKAEVVDAGGKGVCLIFEGMMSVFKNGLIIEAETKEKALSIAPEDDAFSNAVAEFDEVINFTYCTEFIVGIDCETALKPVQLRDYLQTIGDCVVVVDDEEIIKVHVHTEDPGLALQEALKYGQLLTVKVENMREQNRKALEIAKGKSGGSEKSFFTKLEEVKPSEEYGFVSIAAGEGLNSLFKDLGCSHVIKGGQTMNPSTEDILEAVKATPAKVVYVLPNNKNILLAAKQVCNLVEDRKVILVPTKTIPQGVSAMLAFDPMMDPSESLEHMAEAANRVSTGQVTFAARNSEYGGFRIKKGDILSFDNGKLLHTDKDPVKAICRLARAMIRRNTSFLTIMYGENITESQAKEAEKIIKSKIPNHIDITLVEGGQPVYYFIISVE